MKNFIYASLICWTIIPGASAQGPISYGDFTNWVQDSLGNLDPEGWVTTNSLYSSPTILQDTDRLSGAGYSVKFVSVLDAVSGDYENGMLTLENQPFSGSTRPSTLRGFWKKVSISNSNIFGLEIKMFNSSGTEIGYGSAHTPLTMSVPNWTAFTVPINYTTGDPVNSYEIIVAAYNFTDDPNMASHIDDLAFDVSTFVSEPQSSITDCFIRSEGGNFILELIKTKPGDVEVQFFDLSGRQISSRVNANSMPGRNSIPISINQIHTGVYLCKVVTNGEEKLIRFLR